MDCDESEYEEALAALHEAEAERDRIQAEFDSKVELLGACLDSIWDQDVLFYACSEAEAELEAEAADLAEELEAANDAVDEAEAAVEDAASRLCECYQENGGMPL
jgi:chromosome segregation ATPase